MWVPFLSDRVFCVLLCCGLLEQLVGGVLEQMRQTRHAGGMTPGFTCVMSTLLAHSSSNRIDTGGSVPSTTSIQVSGSPPT